MSVAQPQILLVLNDASGTTVVNDGSVATDATVGQGTENTHWAWHTGEGSWDGYWQSLTAEGANQAWISMTAIAMPTTLASEWIAIGFRLASYATGHGYLAGSGQTNDVDGAMTIRAGAPAGGGDFDLTCFVRTTSGNNSDHTFSALSFGVDYQVVAALDASTPSATVAKFKLGANAVVSNASQDWTANTFNSVGGYIGRSNGFSNYYGFTGRMYYYARGHGTLLSDQDMADINNDPSVIDGWPSSAVNDTAAPLGVAGTGHAGTALVLVQPAPPYTLMTITG